MAKANRDLTRAFVKLHQRLTRHRMAVSSHLDNIDNSMAGGDGEEPGVRVDYIINQASLAIEQLNMMKDLSNNFAGEHVRPEAGSAGGESAKRDNKGLPPRGENAKGSDPDEE